MQSKAGQTSFVPLHDVKLEKMTHARIVSHVRGSFEFIFVSRGVKILDILKSPKISLQTSRFFFKQIKESQKQN